MPTRKTALVGKKSVARCRAVILLALTLQNPAPAIPLSRSPVAILDANDSAERAGATARGESSWDRDLHSRTSGSNSKRGGILPRGTLVVVSARDWKQPSVRHVWKHIANRFPRFSRLLTLSRFARWSVDRRGKIGHKLSSHYLLLTQKLSPRRIAASGGRIPHRQ
jgi:hypothetical protein